MRLVLKVILLLAITPSVFSQSQPYGRNVDKGRMIQVNGIPMYYEMYGEGQPLLILHGNGGYSGSRANIMDELIKQYQVIVLDHRCHGQSGCSDELNYRLMASDINEFLDQVNIDSALVYGHSDGGIIGLIMGFEYPDKVKKLVVSGANIKKDSTGLEPLLVKIMQNYETIEDTKMRKHIKLMVEHPDIEFDELERISSPTLIISGDRDAVRLSHSIRIFQSITNSNLSVLPGTTHFVGEEHPEILIRLLRNFYDQPFRKPSTLDWAKQVAEQIMPGQKY